LSTQISGIIFQCAFMIIVFTADLWANEPFVEHKQSDFTVVYPQTLQHVLSDIVEAYHRANKNLRHIFSWSVSKHVYLIIIKNRSDFTQIAEHPLTVAFAEPLRHIITINYQAVTVDPFSLETTLQHELCHILLGEHLSEHIPRWLNEGIAQWASEGITEIIRPEKNLLQKAAFSGTLIPFYRLEYSFPMESDAFVLAYEQSQNFVVYLVKQYSKYTFLKMLEQMKSGAPLHSAIRSTYGKSLRQLEYEWASSQTQYFEWIIFVINNLYTFLFMGLALVSIIGFIRMKRKKWQYPDDWDENMLQ